MEIGVKAVLAVVMFLVVIAITSWLARDRQLAIRKARLLMHAPPEHDRVLQAARNTVLVKLQRENPETWAEQLEIRPITLTNARRFAEAWRAIQSLFLARPLAAVAEAESLIKQVMRLRGYPVRAFAARCADIRNDHPRVVEHYSEAHRLADLSREGAADAEDLRLAMAHCRALFNELVGPALVPDQEMMTAVH